MTGPQRQIARPSWPTRAGLLALLIASLISWSLAPAARAQGHVYWAWGTSINPFDPAPSGIGRANLDGTGVDQNFIIFHGNPIAIAVDGAHIYWLNTDIRAATIGRAKLDGTGVEPSFITGVGSLPYDLAVDDAHIYWADRAASAAPTSTAPGPTRASSTHRGDLLPQGSPGSRSAPPTSTGPFRKPGFTGGPSARSAARTSTAAAPTTGSSPRTPWTWRSTPPTSTGRPARHRPRQPRRHRGAGGVHSGVWGQGGRGRRRPRLLESVAPAATSGAPTSTAPAWTRPSSPASAPGTWRSTARRPARLRPRRVLRPLRPLRPTTASASAS